MACVTPVTIKIVPAVSMFQLQQTARAIGEKATH
jgi:hypothetical protein